MRVIEIPKNEAVQLIDQQCKGKVEKMLDKLQYDADNGTLLLEAEVEERER